MADSDVNTVLFVRNPMLFLLWEKEGGLSSWRGHWTSKKGGGATRLFGDQADRVVWGPVDSA